MSIFLAKHENGGKLILRLTIGFCLLLHGISKVKGGVGWLTGMLAENGLPGFIAYGVYVGEVVAPILLIVGIFSRPAALVVAFNMLIAILLVHRERMFTLSEQGGAWAIELEMLYLLGALAIYCLGSGKYALSRGKGKWD
jgi:putative oxidoreductase